MRRRTRVCAFHRQPMAALRKLKEVVGLAHVFLLAPHPPLAPVCAHSGVGNLSHASRALTCDRRHDFDQISCGDRANPAARDTAALGGGSSGSKETHVGRHTQSPPPRRAVELRRGTKARPFCALPEQSVVGLCENEYSLRLTGCGSSRSSPAWFARATPLATRQRQSRMHACASSAGRNGDHNGELRSKSGLRFSTSEATPSFTSLPQNPRNSSANDASKIGPA